MSHSPNPDAPRPEPGKVSLKSIAERAGVHRTTVSMALRNHPQIPVPTRERLQQLAREMGYRPNPLVQALMRTRIQGTSSSRARLAYVYPFPREQIHRYDQLVADGARSRARKLGFDLDEFFLDDTDPYGERLSRILHARNIPGVIIAPFKDVGSDLRLDWKNLAAVSIGWALTSPPLHHVSHDHYQGMWLALTQLASAGHRHIGIYLQEEANRRVRHAWTASAWEYQRLHERNIRISIGDLDKADPSAYVAWVRNCRPDIVLTCTPGTLLGWNRGKKTASPPLATLCVMDSPTDLPGVDHRLDELGAMAVDWVSGLLYRNDFGIPSLQKALLLKGTWREP